MRRARTEGADGFVTADSVDEPAMTTVAFTSAPGRPTIDTHLASVTDLSLTFPKLCAAVPALFLADLTGAVAIATEHDGAVPRRSTGSRGCKRHGPFGCACHALETACETLLGAVAEMEAIRGGERRRRTKWCSAAVSSSASCTAPLPSGGSPAIELVTEAPTIGSSIATDGSACGGACGGAKVTVTLVIAAKSPHTLVVSVGPEWRSLLPVSDSWLSREVPLGKMDTVESVRTVLRDLSRKHDDAGDSDMRVATSALRVPTCHKCGVVSSPNAMLGSCGVCRKRVCGGCAADCASCRRTVCTGCVLRRVTFDGMNADDVDNGRCMCVDCL